jgi:hypothetical protein
METPDNKTIIRSLAMAAETDKGHNYWFMYKLLIVAISTCFIGNSYAQIKRIDFSAEVSPVLLYFFQSNEYAKHQNKYNYLFGLNSSVFIIDKKMDLAFSSGLYLKTKRYYSEYKAFPEPSEPETTTDKYTYLSWPITLKSEFNISNDLAFFCEAGIFINWIVSKSFRHNYSNGSVVYGFPSDLESDQLNELYFALGFRKTVGNTNSSIGIKPYLLYKYQDNSRYSNSYYNLGRTSMGLSLVYSYFISRDGH